MGVKRIVQKETDLNSDRISQIRKLLKNIVADTRTLPQRIPATTHNKIIFCLSDGRITDYGQFITGNIGELFKTRNRSFKASYYEIWDKVPGTKQDYWLNRMYFHIYKIDEDSTKEYVLLHTDPIDDDVTHGDYKRSPHIHIKDISDDNIAHAHIALNITDYDEAFSNITNLNDCFLKHVKMIANQILKI